MTEKLLTSPLLPPPPPSPPSPDPGDGVKIQLISRTASTQTNNKDIFTGTTCADPGFFVRWGRGPGPQLILQCTEGVNGFITHFLFSRGGGGVQ